jgi:DNA-binding Lrp family transcriptional regulator
MGTVYPIIVKHMYPRKYLMKKCQPSEIIVSGDRDVVDLNESALKVLLALRDHPRESIVSISKAVDLDPKTIVRMKKHLESQRILRRYTTIMNYGKVGIKRYRIFLELDYEDIHDIDKFLEYAKVHPNIVEATKIIGSYELLVTVEEEGGESDLINGIRREFRIADYEILSSERVEKSVYLPNAILE